MTTDEAIRVLERNRNANKDKQKFCRAIDIAIRAINEHRQLTNRCYAVISCGGVMCHWCGVECQHSIKGNADETD